ncbi:MAG: efflux RND transporter permease subunit [Gammaproteobacteria bacterium]|nr:efflux RND transporter permease subunit [Gammaproteobacteria bacterium]
MANSNLSEWGLKHRALTAYFIVLVLALGGWAFTNLGQTDMPNYTLKLMVIRVLWPGATAEEMALQVADRIELKLQETPWLDNIKTYSKPGESVLLVAVDDAAPNPKKTVPEIWYQIRKKVSDMRLELPDGVIGPFFNDEFGDVFPLVYALSGEAFDYGELEDAVKRMRQQLLLVPSVEKVYLWGEQEERIFVEFSAARLAQLGVHPARLVETLQARNKVEPSGFVENSDSRIYVRVDGGYHGLEEIKDTAIEAADGRLLRLGDIAEVKRGFIDPPQMKMRFNGQQSIGLAISMSEGDNVLDFAALVTARIAELEKTLPLGMTLNLVADQPTVVDATLKLFLKKLAIAIGIVLVVSYFSLGLRSGLVVATAFPLVLSITFVMMHLIGIDLQRISLGALIISLGLLVDDAIIIIEMMLIKMEEGLDRFAAATFAYTSTSFPMLSGTLVSMMGFMPMALAQSGGKEFLFGLYMVLTIALLSSWVVSVIFTPYIGYHLLPDVARDHEHSEKEVYSSRFYQTLRVTVGWCVGHRGLVVVLVLGLLGGAIYSTRFLNKQFFPLTPRPELIVELWGSESAPFDSVEREVQRFEEIVLKEDGVVNIASYLGMDTPRIFTDLTIEQPQPNMAKLYILTEDVHQRAAVKDRVLTLLDEEFPALRGRVDYFMFGPPAGIPLQLRVMGEDPELLRGIAKRVEEVFLSHPLPRDVHSDWRGRINALHLRVDQDKAQALGLSSQDLSRNLNMLLTGLPATQLREGDKRIDIVLRLQEADRVDPARLAELPVALPDGRSIPLGQVAHVELQAEEGVYWRYNRFPTITVRGSIPLQSTPHEVMTDIGPQIDEIRATLPDGYFIEIAGVVEVNADMDAALTKVIPIVFLGIVTILMIQLQSFSRTAMVLATAPLGIIGAVVILMIVGLPLGFVAQLGILAMAGIVMRNSVILVDQIRQDLIAGRSEWDAVIESTVRRFRPIVLTSVAAVFALIPLTTDTFWGPMAWAMMGGLTVATALTVLFVPALYAAWFRVKPEAEAR